MAEAGELGHWEIVRRLSEVIVPIHGNPRLAAGQPLATDQNQCQLKPLNRGDYASITFTDAQWDRLHSFRGSVSPLSLLRLRSQR